MEFTEFIRTELLILIPVLYLIGTGLKQMPVKDHLIPLILGACGVILACIYVVATEPLMAYQDVLLAIFAAATQGVLCAGAAVYANQIIKQSKKGD